MNIDTKPKRDPTYYNVYQKCVKVTGNTKWQQKDQMKAQSKELLELVAVSVSQEGQSKSVKTKKRIKKEERMGRKKYIYIYT